MTEEKREILKHLVEYLQDKLDTGYHKIFYNDDIYDEKTIDCINAINDTLEENKRLHSIIKEARDFVESMEYCGQEDYFYDLKTQDHCGNDNTFNDSKHKFLEILDKENK